MFFIKKFPFRKAVIIFCLVNIYIIISWRDWRYGGSYSTRALVQSYPVFALAFAGFINYIQKGKGKYLFYVLGIYLIFLNFFQIKQYFNTILHYYDMNRRYYGRIYLDQQPSALDMSMLDTKEWIRNEKRYTSKNIFNSDSAIKVNVPENVRANLVTLNLSEQIKHDEARSTWLKIRTNIMCQSGFTSAYLNSEIQLNDSIKQNKIRLFRPLAISGKSNEYAFYVKVPEYFREANITIYLYSGIPLNAEIKTLKVFYFEK